MFLKFHRRYPGEQGDLISDFDLICDNYLKKLNGFSLDLLMVFPLEILCLAAPGHLRWLVFSYLRLPRVLRYIRLMEFFANWEKELDTK